jgi:hypothetical protein
MTSRDQFRGPITTYALQLDLSYEVPASPGIYLWRRIFVRPKDSESLSEQSSCVKRQADAPLAVYSDLRLSPTHESATVSIRSHFVTLEQLRIGAANLAPDDLLPANAQTRANVLQLLESMCFAFGPVLYVGEASNLRTRIKQHLSGSTGLVDRLKQCGLEFSDIALFYFELEALDARDRQRLERLLTHMTWAPLSMKAGK